MFDEPEVTGDFGAVLMRAVEEKEKIVETLAGKIEDERHKSYVEHGLREMLMQRVFQTACGYEDEYCLMPFHVYEGLSGKFITAMIRPGKTPTGKEILSLLILL